MSYHLVNTAFDAAAEKVLSQRIKNYKKGESDKDNTVQQLSKLLVDELPLKQLTLKESGLLLIEVPLNISVDTDLLENIAFRLSEVYPSVLFIISNQANEHLRESSINFPGNYLRQDKGVVYANMEDASHLFHFIKKNRVAVIEEGEGRDRQHLINVALNIWRKEKKSVLPIFIHEHLQSYHEIFSAMYSFLTEIHKAAGLKQQLELLKTTQEKLELLTSMLHEYCLPVFVFENISTWFDSTGKPFYNYRDVTDWLYKLAGNGGEYLVITNSNITGEIGRLPIFKPKQNDFYAYKAKLVALLNTGIYNSDTSVETIRESELKVFFEKTRGSEVAQQLGLWLHLKGKITLTAFSGSLQVKTKGLEKRAFLKIAEKYLPEELLQVYALLAKFNVPVSLSALKEQLANNDLESLLSSVPLIEKFEDNEQEKYFYLHPGCRSYFGKRTLPAFDHKKAGYWHQSKVNVPQRGLAHLKEAYRHFKKAEYDEGIKRTGTALCQHYYKAGNYPVAHHYGLACYQQFEQDIPPAIINCLALIFKKYKKPEESLFFFKILHEKYANDAPHKKQIRILNYMSMLHFEMKDIENYMHFGLKAYKLSLELKETREIYQIGQSLGRFLYMGGKKEGGLQMLQQSYQIGVSKGYTDVGELEMFLRNMGEM